MTEGRTTAIFAAVAAVALGLAWWSKPESAISEKDAIAGMVGEEVFGSFDDPEAAASMQIVKYDEELAQLRRFEVARDKQTKLWTLPSHDGYPADAAEQVRNATTPFIDLRVLNVVSDLKSDHELYGVVNPDDEQLAAGTSGVGMLVTFKDDADQVLASLVIGKEVEQAEGQRYVRIPTEDVVYKVEISTDAFTTDFRDWIEGELLGVRSMDIRKVAVRDYTIERSLTQVTLQRNFDAEVQYTPDNSEWSLVEMTSYAGGSPTPAELEEGEELNSEFLNSLRTAVQDLEIIDVQRKPQGLAADLKADDSLLQDQESIAALQQQGFYAAQGLEGTEIFAAGGETIVGTEDGVDYLLRFGEATASLSSMGGEDDEDGGLSRYLLVTAKLDDSKFPPPDLEPLPETVEEMLAREAKANGEEDSTDEPSAEEPSAEEPSAEETTAEEPSAEEPNAEANADSSETEADAGAAAAGKESDDSAENADSSTEIQEPADNAGGAENTESPEAAENADSEGNESEDGEDQAEPAEENATSSEDSVESADSDSGDEAVSEDAPDSDDRPSAETTESEDPAQAESQESQEELQERLEAVREEIAKENQRKIDERNDRIDAARKKVLELNARFSDWYYVVADSAYEKLKITREDLIKKSDDAADEESNSFSQGIPGLEGLQLPQQP